MQWFLIPLKLIATVATLKCYLAKTLKINNVRSQYIFKNMWFFGQGTWYYCQRPNLEWCDDKFARYLNIKDIISETNLPEPLRVLSKFYTGQYTVAGLQWFKTWSCISLESW